MQAKKPIDQFLPVRFKHGSVVKQFSKPCIKCGQVLQANQMLGILRVIDDHIALAAEASCHQCHTQFGVACVIDNDKKVRRVALPAFLFGWYLRALPEQPAEMEQQTLSGPAAEEPRNVTLAKPQAAPTPPQVDYPRASVSVGQYQGKPIPAYILVAGREIPFDHIALDGTAGSGEFLIDGLFVYKQT